MLRYNWIKSILNFPYRFTKTNLGIKNVFFVYRIVRVVLTLPTKESIFTFEIFSEINWINE